MQRRAASSPGPLPARLRRVGGDGDRTRSAQLDGLALDTSTEVHEPTRFVFLRYYCQDEGEVARYIRRTTGRGMSKPIR